MHKITHQLAGELGEKLALSKFGSIGLPAYLSPPGAPGHDIIVVTTEGPKSIEVKTRQYIEKPSEISRWPVDMNTKADADYFLFIELALKTLEPTFYLLSNVQAKTTHKNYNDSGNCIPKKVRAAVAANDFSALTGEPPQSVQEKASPISISPVSSNSATNELRRAIAQEAVFKQYRVIQYACQSIDVFVDGILQGNAIKILRHIAKQLGVSENNASGGQRNTRQLGKTVIEAIKDRS